MIASRRSSSADAWRRADSGAAFLAALAELGLRLAMGEKVPVLVSPGGATHPLLRAINNGGERAQGKPIRKADLEARLREIVLPEVGNVKTPPGFDAGAFAVINLDRLPPLAAGTVTPASAALPSKRGGTIVTLVLSVSHRLGDKLADLSRVVKKASTGARAGGPWYRKIKPALSALGVLVDHHVRYGQRYG